MRRWAEYFVQDVVACLLPRDAIAILILLCAALSLGMQAVIGVEWIVARQITISLQHLRRQVQLLAGTLVTL